MKKKYVYGIFTEDSTVEMLFHLGVFEDEDKAYEYLEKEFANAKGVWVDAIEIND